MPITVLDAYAKLAEIVKLPRDEAKRQLAELCSSIISPRPDDRDHRAIITLMDLVRQFTDIKP